MSQKAKCPHGFEVGVYRGYTGAMAAPYSFCECCRTNYYYIDSGNMGGPWDGAEGTTRIETWEHDKKLCPECGGKIRHKIIEDGRTVLDESLPPPDELCPDCENTFDVARPHYFIEGAFGFGMWAPCPNTFHLDRP